MANTLSILSVCSEVNDFVVVGLDGSSTCLKHLYVDATSGMLGNRAGGGYDSSRRATDRGRDFQDSRTSALGKTTSTGEERLGSRHAASSGGAVSGARVAQSGGSSTSARRSATGQSGSAPAGNTSTAAAGGLKKTAVSRREELMKQLKGGRGCHFQETCQDRKCSKMMLKRKQWFLRFVKFIF